MNLYWENKERKPFRPNSLSIGLLIAFNIVFLASCVPEFGGAGIPPTITATTVTVPTVTPAFTLTPTLNLTPTQPQNQQGRGQIPQPQ